MTTMKITEGIVLENEAIADGVYRMDIESVDAALAARPGQFINLYTKNPATLLPRPISVCWTDGPRLTLVYGVVGQGTREFSTYRAGLPIRLSMPVGNGYDLTKAAPDKDFTGVKKAMVVGGGIGVPPLLELTYTLVKQGVGVIAVIGFQDEPFLMKPLLKAGADLYVATDSGTSGFHGNVVGLIKKEGLAADAYFACGPKPMLKALTGHVLAGGADIQISMEERMGCGYGACVGCVCKTKRNGMLEHKKVCKDGPIFWGSEVAFDE